MCEVAGERARTSATDDTPPAGLPDDIVAEILVLLPAKSVIRSGAVCKAWRRVTTDPHFRARRLPASILVYTHLHAAPSPASDLLARGYHPQDVALDAFPVTSGDEADRRRLIRYPRVPSPGHCWLRGSCEGVLLFEANGGLFLLCNPVTRQWAQLPRLPDQYHKHLYRREYAFYFLQSSGNFQLLCRQDCYTWYIVSTGAAEPRRLRIRDTDAVRVIEFIPFTSEIVPPVALHGNLHWLPSKGPRDNETRMVAFDTVSESFHLMVGPPREARTPPMMKLFEMDGLLVAAAFTEGKYHVDLWFLEDYNAPRWELRHRVTSPWKNSESLLINVWELMSVAAYDDEENVILGDHNGLIVYNVRTRATVRTVRARTTVRTVKSVLWRSPLYIVSPHVFRGSRVQHACFDAQPSAGFPLIYSWC